jgi:hypothetical protein
VRIGNLSGSRPVALCERDVASASPTDLRYPDIYFTPGYGACAAIFDNGAWRSANMGDRIMLPYVVRQLEDGESDAVSPYGYSGFHVSPECSSADLRAFWKSIREDWREGGMASLFLRFSPMDRNSVAMVRQLEAIDLARRGDTVLIPLGRGVDYLWRGMESRGRNMVRKAQKAGFTGRIRSGREADLMPGSPFRVLYEETMRRIGSDPMYLLGDDYYTALARGVGPALKIAEVCDGEGAVVASSLVLAHRERVHYHLAGSTPQAARLGANNLLVWSILTWSEEHDKNLVHLGGGVTQGDGLFNFK